MKRCNAKFFLNAYLSILVVHGFSFIERAHLTKGKISGFQFDVYFRDRIGRRMLTWSSDRPEEIRVNEGTYSMLTKNNSFNAYLHWNNYMNVSIHETVPENCKICGYKMKYDG